jgi:N-acetylmuramoyl-L-alanine amidase
MVFKIAYAAGHCLTTAGKRLPKSLDPNETREWVLNDRVARHFVEAAKAYEGVELLRLDDPTGKAGHPVEERAKDANEWGADFLLEIHHNAGINLGNGGGIVAFCEKEKTEAAKYRDEIYSACIVAGGLKGNRATPKQAKAYTILKEFKGAGVLMEYGFMDSKTDAPVILTDDYSKAMAYATMEGIAKVAGLVKKADTCTVNLPILTKGATGQSVYVLQSLVGCEPTGKFGAITEEKVKAFQKANGLTPSGKCGEKTWEKLLGV